MRILTKFIALLLGLATAASYFDAWWWGLALISHFRPHLAAASLLSGVISLLSRDRLSCALSLVLLATNAVPLLPYFSFAASAAVPHANLRVLAFNMHGMATDRAEFRELIGAEHPDLVVLSEISGGIRALQAETPQLPPYISGEPRGVLDSVVLFSRWPLTNVRDAETSNGEAGILSADVCASDRWDGCLRIIALHGAPPFGTGATTQAEQLAIVARLAAAAPERGALVAGDLDVTPWSPAFETLLAHGKLVDTGLRRGLTATWLSRVPVIGLLIDHVLVSPGISVADNHLGNNVGSSHFPVIVDLTISPLAR
ncbi:MAG TPA: endonuclease/exonuclease/phosphatase family protein [Stellaceae bacterium]|nr:endonuclease/exonuclease/phosphatase family protein [Stellaceae bacterium]